METKIKSEKQAKEFLKSKLKTVVNSPSSTSHAHHSAGTIEEQLFIGHSRNSRKHHYFEVNRD